MIIVIIRVITIMMMMMTMMTLMMINDNKNDNDDNNNDNYRYNYVCVCNMLHFTSAEELDPAWNEESLKRLMANADANADGKLQTQEFVNWIFSGKDRDDSKFDA